MDEVNLVRGNSECDALLLCAVQWVMHEEIENVVNRFFSLIPPELHEQFVDYVCERTFLPTKMCLGDRYEGSPDLMGDEAYRDYVRKVMEVKRGNDLL